MKCGLGFESETLPLETLRELEARANLARGDILTMTTLASSGHPGGSLSSVDLLMTLYACANVDPSSPYRPDRDRIVVSNGHVSPAVYATLARNGFHNIEDVICGFRQEWSPFEGHIERDIPGVEWTTGNLGQGLSAGCGMALASRLSGTRFNVFVLMGDGEQQKGQLSEGRRFASKYKLNNLTALIDFNRLQISGDVRQVMPQDIKANWEADGWEVLEIDGHDLAQIYGAIRYSLRANCPVCILCLTLMGRGVPEMENKAHYHGSPLKRDEYERAVQFLKVPHRLETYEALRPVVRERTRPFKLPRSSPRLDQGTPRTYDASAKTDNRSAFGTALAELAATNPRSPMAVFDCDLGPSVKTLAFAKARPESFFQAGIQEHHTATMAGALSAQGIRTFWADFGVFGTDETFNQQRLNDINHATLKTVLTHCGLDVGEDGKTHHGINFLGLMRNLFGARVIVPADPNETDRVIRHVATQKGSFVVAMGRSIQPIVLTEEGQPFFGSSYTFEYGRASILREGTEAAILSMGSMSVKAVAAAEKLRQEGIRVRVIHIATPLSIDRKILRDAAALGLLFTYEDHNVRTGLGSLVAEALIEEELSPRLVKLGVADYQPSGPSEALFRVAGLDEAALIARVRDELFTRNRRIHRS